MRLYVAVERNGESVARWDISSSSEGGRGSSKGRKRRESDGDGRGGGIFSSADAGGGGTDGVRPVRNGHASDVFGE